MDIRVCGAVVAGLCAGAPAQEVSATWLWDVTTQDGDAIVEPGETATVTLTLLMEVEAGKDEVFALADTRFDTLGGTNAANGSIAGWELLNKLGDFAGDHTATDGVSLFETYAANCFGIQMIPCTLDNPIDVLAFEWTTADYSGYTVDYATSTEFVSVWKDLFGDQDYVQVGVSEALISFQVVPVPSIPVCLSSVIGALALRRRRGVLP
jgi:hypothetical protein